MKLFNRTFPKIIISLAGVGLVALAIVLLSPSPAPAQPVISWVPETLNETVLAGETKTVSVSFTAPEDLGAVEVRVVPELETFLRTEPTSFASIPAGQETNIEIIISAAADATTQVVEGTIQIRNAGRPPRNFARPLSVTINVSGLPPDPGEAGKATLEGIDSDGDGVRDDIQRYIALTYPDSERTRAALMQATKATQAFLLETGGRGEVITRAEEKGRATDCISFIRPNDDSVVYGELKARLLNTDERSRQWIANDAKLSGHVFTVPPPSRYRLGCDFDPDTMEN